MARAKGYEATRHDIIGLASHGRTIVFATWDNPSPADSSSMLSGLRSLGLSLSMNTKTSIVVALKPSNSWRDLRCVIENNLNKKKGRAVYVNLKSSRVWEFDYATTAKWVRKA